MPITFKNVPANLRVPLFYAEVDNSQANTAQFLQRTLLIGQKTSAGSAPANVPIKVGGVSDARTYAGPNSVLAQMADAYFANDAAGEVYLLPIDDPSGGVAATATLTFTAQATANGTFYLYLCGTRYALPVLATQTVSQLAAAMVALINADPLCPVTASAVGAVVTLTSDNTGKVGNGHEAWVNYRGAPSGEVLPAGLAYTLAVFSGGTGVRSLVTDAIPSLGNDAFDFIVLQYPEVTNLDELKVLLSDVNGRWSYLQQLYGHVFCANSGTLGDNTTFGQGRNNQHETLMAFAGGPTPVYRWSAAVAGASAVSLRNDPALPLHTVAVLGIVAPRRQNQYTLTERNSLLYAGMSTFTVDDDGTVRLEGVITTYQKNAFGAPDNSYLKVETLFTLAYVLRFMKTAITSKFARVKLASSSQRIGAGASVVTPNVIRAELIAQYRELESRGYVQNVEAFKAALVVEQNASNPNRVDVLWPGTLINQLDVLALLAQFRLN